MRSLYIVFLLAQQQSALTSPAWLDRTTLGTLDVPRLGLGTIGWTESSETYSPISKAAIEAGLDFFDTAERYGANDLALIPSALANIGISAPGSNKYLGGDTETRLATWAKNGNVATKLAPTPWRGDASSIVSACRLSAERLGVPSVALMQIHMPDVIQPFKRFGISKRREEEHWDGLAECYLSGIARNVGVSNYGPTLLERAFEHLARRGVPLASNQIHLNLLYRHQGSLATLKKGSELGIQTLAYYPLAMGLLTGKLSAEKLRARGGLRARDLVTYLEGGPDSWLPPNTPGAVPPGGVQPLLRAIGEVADRNRKTMAQVALNWVVCKGAIPIPGASSVEQVRFLFNAAYT